MGCSSTRMAGRPVLGDGGPLGHGAIIDQGIRTVDVAKLLTLREELLALSRNRTRDLIPQRLPLRLLDGSENSRVTEKPPCLCHPARIEYALIRIHTGNWPPLRLIRIEQTIPSIPSEYRLQLPNEVGAVLDAAVHPESAVRRKAMCCITCDEDAPRAPVVGDSLVMLPVQYAFNADLNVRRADCGPHDLGATLVGISPWIHPRSGLEVVDPFISTR